MPTGFRSVETLRRGDPQGNRMVIRLTTHAGRHIHAIAVPQDWPSRTGPTWCYVFSEEGVNLIDAGAQGSFAELEDGLRVAGYSMRDIDRVIVTHSHLDHDGATPHVVDAARAELWAHTMYAALVGHNPRFVQDRGSSPIHTEMQRVVFANFEGRPSPYVERSAGYANSRKGLTVDRQLEGGERVGEMRFLYTPGHSPDELCVTLDGLVFTGDHVLPEITPHPTTKAQFARHILPSIPTGFEDSSRSYGLETYMRSLKTVLDLGPNLAILPAHRLFNRGRFNFVTADRAREVIEHHSERMDRILRRISPYPDSLESVTRGEFSHRKLQDGNLFMALAEVVAHVELLRDLGDLELTPDSKLRHLGSRRFHQFVQQLLN